MLQCDDELFDVLSRIRQNQVPDDLYFYVLLYCVLQLLVCLGYISNWLKESWFGVSVSPQFLSPTPCQIFSPNLFNPQ